MIIALDKSQNFLKPLFKGIALFTPGGDLIYCLDPSKQGRWHTHLCNHLQEILDLPEPPHFLVPGYTATVDRWLDHTGKTRIVAEVYPAVQRYQALLNVLFATGDLVWQGVPWQEEFSNPIVLASYRQQFPQLWENHELIVRFELNKPSSLLSQEKETTEGYILHLFVSGNNNTTRKILERIHQLLEQNFPYTYTLKVIDISKHPEETENYQISAIPTLVRVWPLPIKRIIGQLEDEQRFLQILLN